MHVRICTYCLLLITLFVVGPVSATHHDRSPASSATHEMEAQDTEAQDMEAHEKGAQEAMDCDTGHYTGHCPACISESNSNAPEHGCSVCFEVDTPGSSALILHFNQHQTSSKALLWKDNLRGSLPICQSADPPISSEPDSPVGQRFRVLRL